MHPTRITCNSSGAGGVWTENADVHHLVPTEEEEESKVCLMLLQPQAFLSVGLRLDGLLQ